MTEREQELPSPKRRRFLKRLTLSLGGLGAGILGVPFIAVVLSPVRRQARDVWQRVGRLEDFGVGRTAKVIYRDPQALPWAGFVAESVAWVRREADDRVSALSAYCTHVGCPVNWDEAADLFFCPCHGGAFHRDGSVAAGPPPRPLPLHPIRIRDGYVELQPIPIRPRRG